jgi:hypothetical protein
MLLLKNENSKSNAVDDQNEEENILARSICVRNVEYST